MPIVSDRKSGARNRVTSRVIAFLPAVRGPAASFLHYLRIRAYSYVALTSCFLLGDDDDQMSVGSAGAAMAVCQVMLLNLLRRRAAHPRGEYPVQFVKLVASLTQMSRRSTRSRRPNG